MYAYKYQHNPTSAENWLYAIKMSATQTLTHTTTAAKYHECDEQHKIKCVCMCVIKTTVRHARIQSATQHAKRAQQKQREIAVQECMCGKPS